MRYLIIYQLLLFNQTPPPSLPLFPLPRFVSSFIIPPVFTHKRLMAITDHETFLFAPPAHNHNQQKDWKGPLGATPIEEMGTDRGVKSETGGWKGFRGGDGLIGE